MLFVNESIGSCNGQVMGLVSDCSSVAGRRYVQLQRQVDQLSEELYRSETGNFLVIDNTSGSSPEKFNMTLGMFIVFVGSYVF